MTERGEGNSAFIFDTVGDADLIMPYLSEENSSAFKEFARRFVNIVVQADVALGNKSCYTSVQEYVGNFEPLLLEYGKMILAKKAPEGWEKRYFQILDNLDPKTLPFSLKDRNPECIALLKYCESTEFYDPVLDGLLGAFKYDRSYFDKIVSSLTPSDVEARINFISRVSQIQGNFNDLIILRVKETSGAGKIW